MTTFLAIDPGCSESAWVLINPDTCKPLAFAKEPNDQILNRLKSPSSGQFIAAIEMVASYGMAVGAEVFETVRWIGRFEQTITDDLNCQSVHLVTRLQVKLHHCHDSKAKDSNITRALVDRFAYGQPNHGKGTKAAPGWFYGFHRDIWQAYALAVYAADTLAGEAA